MASSLISRRHALILPLVFAPSSDLGRATGFRRAPPGPDNPSVTDTLDERTSTAAGRVEPLIDGIATLPELILKVPSGALMRLYQTFPIRPLALAQGSRMTETIEELARVVETARRRSDYQANPLIHRVVALPALASIHALAHLSGDEKAHAEQRILHLHDAAMVPRADIGSPRDLLQMLWQNLTAALIRNDRSWSGLRVSRALLRRGLALVDDYLRESEGVALLQAALCAWQFLDTYRRARWSERHEGGWSQEQMHELRIRYADNPSFAWFAAMSDILAQANSHGERLPQFSEAFMGSLARPSDADYRSMRDLVVLSKLSDQSLYRRIDTGDINPPYTTVARARVGLRQNPSFLANFGVRPKDEAELLRRCDIWRLPEGVANAVREGLRDLSIEHTHHLERPELVDAGEIARQVPFRRDDEEVVAEEALRKDADYAGRLIRAGAGEASTDEALMVVASMRIPLGSKDAAEQVRDMKQFQALSEALPRLSHKVAEALDLEGVTGQTGLWPGADFEPINDGERDEASARVVAREPLMARALREIQERLSKLEVDVARVQQSPRDPAIADQGEPGTVAGSRGLPDAHESGASRRHHVVDSRLLPAEDPLHSVAIDDVFEAFIEVEVDSDVRRAARLSYYGMYYRDLFPRESSDSATVPGHPFQLRWRIPVAKVRTAEALVGQFVNQHPGRLSRYR